MIKNFTFASVVSYETLLTERYKIYEMILSSFMHKNCATENSHRDYKKGILIAGKNMEQGVMLVETIYTSFRLFKFIGIELSGTSFSLFFCKPPRSIFISNEITFLFMMKLSSL